MTNKIIAIGEKLPNFSLKGIDEKGGEKLYTNKDFNGKPLIIYFYPKDDTPGCTKEACNFNNMLSDIKSKANIVGVSADNVESHKKFQKKYSLNFPLLSDTDVILANHLGATKDKLLNKLLSKGIGRLTFLIDDKGLISKVWDDVTVDNHDKEVLDALNKL